MEQITDSKHAKAGASDLNLDRAGDRTLERRIVRELDRRAFRTDPVVGVFVPARLTETSGQQRLARKTPAIGEGDVDVERRARLFLMDLEGNAPDHCVGNPAHREYARECGQVRLLRALHLTSQPVPSPVQQESCFERFDHEGQNSTGLRRGRIRPKRLGFQTQPLSDKTLPMGTPYRIALAATLVAAALAGGCRQDMHDQPRHEPLEASTFFADGRSARPLVPGTIPRGGLHEDPILFTGKTADGAFAETIPFAIDRAFLDRGRERYNIFCTPCHDHVGTGRGMAVRRGFPQAASFHIDRLRNVEPGYFFDVITKGFGRMPEYATQILPRDRWAIVAYVRALQLSQNVPEPSLTPEERRELGRELEAAPPAGGRSSLMGTPAAGDAQQPVHVAEADTTRDQAGETR